MPIQYRSFYLRKLVNIQEKQKREYEKQSGAVEAQPQSKVVKGPGVNKGR
jgi:hypothetical protein